jgi:CBS domain-containing protein
MKVDEILESKGRDVVTCAEETPISEAAKLLLEKSIGVLVVTDAARNVAGIISERDIIRGLVELGDKLFAMPLALSMKRSVITCSADNSIEHAMQLMSANKIRHLPVVDDSKLIGVISIVDVVRALLAETKKKVKKKSWAMKNPYCGFSPAAGDGSGRPIVI